MKAGEHLRLTGGALKNWFVAQTQDAIAVGLLWLIGLWIIGIPWTPLWALIGALTQYIPNFGPIIAVIPPALVGFAGQDSMRGVYVLILYAIIVVFDGLVLQPYLMKRTVKVPIWASLLTPLVLGIAIPFWGVLLSPPLLAVIYAYRHRPGRGNPPLPPVSP